MQSFDLLMNFYIQPNFGREGVFKPLLVLNCLSCFTASFGQENRRQPSNCFEAVGDAA